MRHVGWITGLIILSFILAIIQYPVTGVYGRLMFAPIMGFLTIGYLLKETLKLSK
jgi:hypothetical protein